MSRAKQSVKKGVWYIGGKKNKTKQNKNKKVKEFLQDLLLQLHELYYQRSQNQFLKKYLEEKSPVKKLKDGKANDNFKKKSKSKSSKSAKRQIFHEQMGKNKQKTAPDKYKSKQTANYRPKKKQQNDLFKLSCSCIQKKKKKKKTKYNQYARASL